jgi:hypothetical protein
MLAEGQRGRSSRGSDAPPGLRVTPQQGEGPQPSVRESKRGGVALGGHNQSADALNP